MFSLGLLSCGCFLPLCIAGKLTGFVGRTLIELSSCPKLENDSTGPSLSSEL